MPHDLNKKKGIFGILALLFLLTAWTPVRAAGEAADPPAAEKGLLGTLVCYAGEGEEGAIRPQRTGEGAYLFLPASADLTALRLWFAGPAGELGTGDKRIPLVSGEAMDLTALFPIPPESGAYPVELIRDGKKESLTILRSANIASLYITSRDPEQGREWVDADKEHKAKKGGIMLLRPDGTAVYSGTIKTLKSRGNSTWFYPKKPYQIKLNEAADLMETGVSGEADTTWILLANYVDDSLLRNQFSFGLAEELGLPYTPHCRPVDLYYDGEYRGSYLLTEKTEIGEGRVEIRDLEEEIEALNRDAADLDALETRQGLNSMGNAFQYVDGVRLPEDYSGGYLLELDYPARAKAEKCWFSTSQGLYVEVKSPEYLPEEAMLYLSELFQRAEDSLYNGGVEPQTGRSCWELLDRESLAKEYVLLELSRDMDAFLSSTYFYKPEGDEKLYAGPVWDFDSAYGISLSDRPVQGFVAGETRLGMGLMLLPSFREAVLEADEELRPGLEALLGGGEEAAEEIDPASLGERAAVCASSRAMDAALWPETLKREYGAAVADLSAFIRERDAWLLPAIREMDRSLEELPRFMDATPQDWFYEDMVYVMDAGILREVNGAGSFCAPRLALSRAMAVTILHRMAGTPEPASEKVWTDVPEGAWYAGAAAWAAGEGILSGYPDGSFRPGRGISRQEFAVLLHRFTCAPAPDLAFSFTDADRIGEYAVPAVAWAVAEGLLRGDDLGMVRPEKTISRAEAAAILHRFMEREQDWARTEGN